MAVITMLSRTEVNTNKLEERIDEVINGNYKFIEGPTLSEIRTEDGMIRISNCGSFDLRIGNDEYRMGYKKKWFNRIKKLENFYKEQLFKINLVEMEEQLKPYEMELIVLLQDELTGNPIKDALVKINYIAEHMINQIKLSDKPAMNSVIETRYGSMRFHLDDTVGYWNGVMIQQSVVKATKLKKLKNN